MKGKNLSAVIYFKLNTGIFLEKFSAVYSNLFHSRKRIIIENFQKTYFAPNIKSSANTDGASLEISLKFGVILRISWKFMNNFTRISLKILFYPAWYYLKQDGTEFSRKIFTYIKKFFGENFSKSQFLEIKNKASGNSSSWFNFNL